MTVVGAKLGMCFNQALEQSRHEKWNRNAEDYEVRLKALTKKFYRISNEIEAELK